MNKFDKRDNALLQEAYSRIPSQQPRPPYVKQLPLQCTEIYKGGPGDDAAGEVVRWTGDFRGVHLVEGGYIVQFIEGDDEQNNHSKEIRYEDLKTNDNKTAYVHVQEFIYDRDTKQYTPLASTSDYMGVKI